MPDGQTSALSPHSLISAEARGRVRQLLADVERDAAEFEGYIERLPAELLDGARWKGQVGSTRAIDRLVARMPRPPDHRQSRCVIWRYAAPLSQIPGDDATRQQLGVAVKVHCHVSRAWPVDRRPARLTA
jgi:hypothetical protein